MEEFRTQHPRLIALFLCVMGVGALIWTLSVVTNGGSIPYMAVGMCPVLLLTGITGLIEPRLMLWYDDPNVDRRFQIYSYIIMGIGVVIGFYLAFTYFKF